ncbi:hypothetical protein FXN65_20280 [Metapseudomonas lalkuanensis]|uniref:Uncharacterized protein n=1 Tax=Metapseudomonas lalkuanensis TaxID=2604832 RepID=A0A5J6QU74_9GAMM|nr:hypothetical protein [Pseudomonas lalkuanensis]QEY64279.1 hypothetical protein FXN65_20280 [Pseudomonas lalkuanensis]
MEAIADKIRHYRQTFRPPVFYALNSLALWLSIGLAMLILGLLFFDLYLRIATNTYLLGKVDQAWLIVYEVPMLFGLMQVYFQGAERRYRLLYPTARRIHFRTPYAILAKEKHAYLRTTFALNGDLRALAKHLIEEWEWRREIKTRAQEPLSRLATGFFKLPSPSNFAAYMTGLVAVLAGIVIATLSGEALFADLEQFLIDTWHLIVQLWLAIVLPFAVCVLPAAVVLVWIKQIGETLLECVNDQFLSHTAFYRFISEVLELHDRGERLLMRKTRAWAYWTVRLTIAPLEDIPRIWRCIKRAKAIAQRSGRVRVHE